MLISRLMGIVAIVAGLAVCADLLFTIPGIPKLPLNPVVFGASLNNFFWYAASAGILLGITLVGLSFMFTGAKKKKGESLLDIHGPGITKSDIRSECLYGNRLRDGSNILTVKENLRVCDELVN